MRLFFLFTRKYPIPTLLMLVCLLAAGLVDGFGLSMLLPLLSIAIPQEVGPAGIPAMGGSKLEKLVADFFAFLNLTPSVANIMVIIVVSVILKSLIIIISRRQVGYTVARIATDLRLELLRAMMAAKWEYYLRERIGYHTSAMLNETKQSSSAFNLGVLMAADFFETLVYIVAAFLVSANASLVAIGLSLFIMVLLRRYIRKVRKTGQRQTQLRRDLLASMTDLFQSFKSLKAMAREDHADYILEKNTFSLQRVQKKQVMSQGMMKALQEPLTTLFLAIGIFLTLVYWHLPLSNMLILLFLIGRVIKQLTKIQERYSEIAILENSYWSFQKTICNLTQQREEISGTKQPVLNKELTLEGVSFSYGDGWALRNVNILFPVGQITAIVGPSGSGKTTILDLVAGLLTPQQGEVRLDGVSLKQIDIRKWRQMIGYVPQEAILMHDTILNNIALGDKNLKADDAVAALKAAGAMEFVEGMPEGIHHVVGERGGKLSGGQRQRIAIARAIVHRPKLLIFDEATSALDPVSEAAVCDTIRQLRGEHTILAISHQTALLKCADQAYDIENGVAKQICPTDGNRLISIANNGI